MKKVQLKKYGLQKRVTKKFVGGGVWCLIGWLGMFQIYIYEYICVYIYMYIYIYIYIGNKQQIY